MKIVFVNRFFHPDISATSQILSDLACHLAEHHRVHVVTSRLKYDTVDEPLASRECVAGATVHRVWSSRFGRDSLIGRSIDYLTFYASAMLRLFTLVKHGDIVVAMTDPPLISIPTSILSRVKGAHLVNWLQDVFPEIAAELGLRLVNGRVGRLLAWVRNRSLMAAVCNVVPGELVAARVGRAAVPARQIRVIHNWSPGDQVKPLDPDANPLRTEWALNGRYVVGYSGNLGRAHEFASLLAAAERLSGRSDIVFLLIGDGKQRAELEARVRQRLLTNVLFRPYQPRARLGHSLTVPDCHVISLKPSLEGLIVPSKLYSSLAAGRPIIFLGARDGEIGRLMSSTNPFGVSVAPDDVRGLVDAIQCLADDRDYSARLGCAGRRLFEQRFAQSIALTQWRALIDDISPRRRQAPAVARCKNAFAESSAALSRSIPKH